MLETQTGQETWRLLVQKNITLVLDINLNYQGRKWSTQTIHTGNMELILIHTSFHIIRQ
jgi:hypothetical protein